MGKSARTMRATPRRGVPSTRRSRFGVAVGTEVEGADVVEAAGGVGAVVGDGASILGPGGRTGIDEQQATDAVREHRRERNGLGAAEGVAGENVGSGLAD